MNSGTIIVQNEKGEWLHFSEPVQICTTRDLESVCPLLCKVEKGVHAGYYAAGFITYEASAAFDPALKSHRDSSLPLVWFGLYRAPDIRPEERAPAESDFNVGEWKASVNEDAFRQAIDRIHAYIKAGDCYQVNYTIRLRAVFQGDPYAYFLSLCRAQQAQCCAYVQLDQQAICCASPELFFTMEGYQITARPMKGTSPRGASDRTDFESIQALHSSEKNRAENVMIVDMVRNDLGRIALPGSVVVSSLFDIERYPTVLQMTSTVKARTGAEIPEVFKAIFPCASITGAPKVRTMQIINELEPDPRGIYTGAIGYLAPERVARFNVAIRTVVIDNRTGTAEYGVGGGIVWDSSASEEYAECLAKASILTSRIPDFELLETMLWTAQEGISLLDLHLARLMRAADYFGFKVSIAVVREHLLTLPLTAESDKIRLRLRIGRTGTIQLEQAPLQNSPYPWKIALANTSVSSRDPFLCHKTTHRVVYETARNTFPVYDDVLLYNERGEVTETTVANIVAVINGKKLTPPETSGLLPGTFREHLLNTGEIEESVIRISDLKRISQLFLINSVRKWIPAVLFQDEKRIPAGHF